METSIEPYLEQAPAGAGVVMIALVITGLVLWLMGKKIVRITVALTGLLLGSAAAFPLSQQFGAGAHGTLAWVIAGAVAGCLIAWLLFRVWMGLSTAAVFAVLVPGVYLVWVGGAAPTPSEGDDAGEPTSWVQPAAFLQDDTEPQPRTNRLFDFGDDADDAADTPDTPRNSAVEDAIRSELTDQQRQIIDEAKRTFFEAISTAYDRYRARVDEWWAARSDMARKNLTTSVAIGGLVGLLMGLLMPNLSAAVQTALVGSILLLYGAWGLLVVNGHDPAESLPFALTGKTVLLALGLITALGIIVQWTVWRKQTDK
jgi:ElaB/YqjD/DUF883 family membrane-anchored ribosome-binding protein